MLTKSVPLRLTSLRISPPFSPATTILLHTHRNASTTTTTTTTSSTSPITTATSSSQSNEKLGWDTFLQLRKQRRRYNLVSSLFTSALGTTAGVGYLANKEIDPTQMIMGMDPIILFGLATVSCGALGWLAGPVLGSSAFSVVKRRIMGQINEREREFLQHIKKNRVDPSFQSFSNPVPDYYGEKIGSIKQYKQWLKDQRAYNRKSKSFL
ncbi:unnamed protein product [Tuber melanosporum]|jgi:import inner membrane translocase subunit TIM23|uniref:Presequence translocated-associated motor subunit PAM17 n=1 Tax=Tuber melanosporum (strain Mel28) TaxID=656061 RepID=D5G4H4_TUBMM|nr:uncharacterized protein GSTUM_00004108001 [Tuber melanosporum]CAZ79417.1 unnamed protein product [Tuber melanosporum]